MAAITTAPGMAFPASPTTRRRPGRTATQRPRRPSPTTFRRRRLATALATLGVVVVLAQAGAALGGFSLAASERRPTVATDRAAVRAVAAAPPGSSSSGAVDARPTPVVGAGHDAGQHLVVVRPGDTLWSIATRVDPDADPRPLVDAMSDARDGAPLVPGETVRVPAD
jgi:nucleoid-associated protein YgaU